MNTGFNHNGRYVVAVAPEQDFIGPLQPDSFIGRKRYIDCFEGRLTPFLEKMSKGERKYWMSRSHDSKDKFPQIDSFRYAGNPAESRARFSSPAMAHLFTIYLRSFFPDDSLTELSIEELSLIGLERHPINCS